MYERTIKYPDTAGNTIGQFTRCQQQVNESHAGSRCQERRLSLFHVSRSPANHVLAIDPPPANQPAKEACWQGFAAIEVWYDRLQSRPIGRQARLSPGLGGAVASGRAAVCRSFVRSYREHDGRRLRVPGKLRGGAGQ